MTAPINLSLSTTTPPSKEDLLNHLKSLTPALTGGGDDKDKSKKSNRLSFDQIKEWNNYASDKDGDLVTLFNNYKKQNPKTSISFDSLRNELDLLSQKSRTMSKDKNELFANDAHVGNVFPTMRVLNGDKLGVVNGDMQTETPSTYSQLPAAKIQNFVPDNVSKLEWDKQWNQPYYLDGDDIVYVDRKFYNSPRFLNTNPTGNLVAKSK